MTRIDGIKAENFATILNCHTLSLTKSSLKHIMS